LAADRAHYGMFELLLQKDKVRKVRNEILFLTAIDELEFDGFFGVFNLLVDN
jgi:hypothetical protein